MFGIFNSDGLLLEDGFFTARSALHFMWNNYSPTDDLYIGEVSETADVVTEQPTPKEK